MFGHIRDLPSKDGSVRPDEDFAMDYQISKDSTKHVKAISDAMKNADTLILATDPDREGEAISWHVLETLKAKKIIKADTKVQRVSFSSITKKAITDAMAAPRDIDMDLVNAQQARRALDYLVGFNLSPVLWRKLPGSKSAGRVQSVALRLICERESDIEKFISQEFWDIKGKFLNTAKQEFSARLTHVQGEKLDKFSLNNEASSAQVVEKLKEKSYTISNIEKKQSKRKPYAPFTTSTLQQEASRKLGFTATRTMQTAQKMYEGIDLGGETAGIITYMRTDGITVAPEAIDNARQLIGSQYGEKYLPSSPRIYQSKQKNAQEAHEAIRPTDPSRRPDAIRQYLNDDQFKLYSLIWKRLIASQMSELVLDQVAATIDTTDGYAQLRANGSTVAFDGFTVLYNEGKDDADDEDDDKRLPPLEKDETPELIEPVAEQHFTQPPPRFTEASLVKKMEELGIGRPSTYAAILSVLQAREYVKLDKKRFLPEVRGRLVTAFLEHFFTKYVEYDFTAQLENELDEVSAGRLEWKAALRAFWDGFHSNVDSAMQLEFTAVIDALGDSLEQFLFPGEGEKESRHKCPDCKDGVLGLKIGRFGAFLGCSNYPECKHTRQLVGGGADDADNDNGPALDGPKLLGKDPETNLDVTLRKGPYGFYVQLGEAVDKKDKPKRQSIPKGQNAGEFTFEAALSLLALPRLVGTHPETGKEIKANIGRYGPYIQHNGVFISLKEDDVLTVGMNRAVELIATQGQKKGAEPLRVIGNHPDDNEEIAVYDGRYGPYVKHKKLNASLSKSDTAESITIERAIELLEIQAAKKGTTTKKKPAAKKKAPAKKAAAKKPAAKKPAAKKKEA